MGQCLGKEAEAANGAVIKQNTDDLHVHIDPPRPTKATGSFASRIPAGASDEEIVHHLTEDIIGHVVHNGSAPKDTIFSPRPATAATGLRSLCACIGTESQGGAAPAKQAVDPLAPQVVHELVSSIIKNVVATEAEVPADVKDLTISTEMDTPVSASRIAQAQASSIPAAPAAALAPVVVSVTQEAAAILAAPIASVAEVSTPIAVPATSIPRAPAAPRAPLVTGAAAAAPEVVRAGAIAAATALATSTTAAVPVASAVPAHRTSSGSDHSQSSDKPGASNGVKKTGGNNNSNNKGGKKGKGSRRRK